MWQQAEQGVREVLFMKLPGSCGNLTHLEVCGPHVSTILPTLARTNFSILCGGFFFKKRRDTVTKLLLFGVPCISKRVLR
jgi:hypothetical protein